MGCALVVNCSSFNTVQLRHPGNSIGAGIALNNNGTITNVPSDGSIIDISNAILFLTGSETSSSSQKISVTFT